MGEGCPLVSVVVPAYNHKRYVRHAIESVLASTIDDIEVIAIDDGSLDHTFQEILSIKDTRLKNFRQENRGAHATMNRGIALAQAPWIAILNSDDVYHPDKLEQHLSLHKRDGNAVASVSRVSYIDSNGRPLKTDCKRVEFYEQDKQKAAQSRSIFHSLLVKNHIITTSALFVRKEVFEQVGGFVTLRYTHDWFMFLSLAGTGKLRIIEEPLAGYRVHAANTLKESKFRLQAEINFLLEWYLHKGVAVYEELTPLEAYNIADLNPELHFDLLNFFQLWRAANKNNPHTAAAPFEDPSHPVLKKAIQILRNDTRGALSRRQLEGILDSMSWRITAPLRRIYDFFEKYFD